QGTQRQQKWNWDEGRTLRRDAVSKVGSGWSFWLSGAKCGADSCGARCGAQRGSRSAAVADRRATGRNQSCREEGTEDSGTRPAREFMSGFIFMEWARV